ncbi:MAG: PDDEXK nuclease domain-containing protein [Candidatus Delongbacteria bacterium]|jgi:predicted nuclease of restriction endonuclease-like (RecB) superfamily|nr:PDDEXK nuclease domain-containing protein [Candidatus Delongbacteria bacterium]
MNIIEISLTDQIKQLITEARKSVIQTVNTAMVYTYYEIGKLIVEQVQKGESKAEYGKSVLKRVSKNLISEFGKGYSVQNLERMRLFYSVYSKSSTLSGILGIEKKSQTLSRKFTLSWSHYVFLIHINKDERQFYEKEAILNNWSVRELKRQYDSALFERISVSKDKKGVIKDNLKKYHKPEAPIDIIKDPYVLEFLNLEEHTKYSETEFETKIINKLQNFILELGKGFLFSGRQVRFSYDEEHFIVDLVFYNRILKCFVLIDLKIGKLKHQDIGQMQMYVNYYDRMVKLKEENDTIGIILCKEKNNAVVKMTLPKNNNQIFASKFQTILPSKEELKKQMDI